MKERVFDPCQKDVCYIAKVMSSHDLIHPMDKHVTYCTIDGVDGKWKTFKYIKPMSCQNHKKQWVNDVNSFCHDSIVFEDVWGTEQ